MTRRGERARRLSFVRIREYVSYIYGLLVQDTAKEQVCSFYVSPYVNVTRSLGMFGSDGCMFTEEGRRTEDLVQD